MPGDMVGSRLMTNKNLHKRSLPSRFFSLNTPDNFLPILSIFGVPLSCQGGLFKKGKQMATNKDSYLLVGQNEGPGEMVKMQSAALCNCLIQSGVDNFGQTIT